MNLIHQIATNAANNKQTALSVYGATAGTGIATALEWIPLVIGAIASIVGLIGASALLYHTHLNIKITKMELKEKKERNGKRTRRDDKIQR